MEIFVVVRYYQPGDETGCRKVVREGTMSTVNSAFIAGLTREFTFQLIVLLSALCFIFLGVPLHLCLLSLPFVILMIYICVYLAHFFKSIELERDISQIPKAYMSNEKTGFWVAEAYEPYFMPPGLSQVICKIVFEEDVKSGKIKLPSLRRTIVGTVAISRNYHDDNTAWLKHLFVFSKYQRQGIGSALITSALRFSQDRHYFSIELVTTECHDLARELCHKHGFVVKQMYHRPIIGSLISILMYQLVLFIDSDKP